MTMHIAEQETPKIVESEDALAEVHRLPTLLTVDVGIQEVKDELRRIAIAASIRREVCAIQFEMNDEDVELTPSAAESQRLDYLRIELGKLTAIRESIADSIRVAHEDIIRKDEDRERQYFATVTTT